MAEDKSLLYQIWLSECCDHDPGQIHRLLQEVGTAEELFHLDLTKPEYSKYLRLGQRLRIGRNLDSAARKLEAWQKKGIFVLSIEDDAYPNRLREVFQPPQLLYCMGEMPDWNQMLGIAVVGSREASQEGKAFARKMATDLTKGGGVIVSGLAKGADSAALWGALEAGGITVAVLAGGVDKIYPKENAELYHHILKRGCILSEQPPGTTGKPYFYSQRNRIMVGLSHGVVVVEGRNKSGTAITARLAQDANADVFAVPGNPMNEYAELPNQLLRDGGIPVTGALDIMEEYLSSCPEKLEYGMAHLGKPIVGVVPEMEKEKEKRTGKKSFFQKKEEPAEERPLSAEEWEGWLRERNFSPEEEKILRVIWERGKDVPFDDIADACGMEIGLLSSQLIILQMKKAISQSAGGRYSLEK